MADYFCFPLWEASPDVGGNIDPKDLPISDVLRIRLLRWADVFDATLNRDDLARSGFVTDDALRRFAEEGALLLERLQRELGPRWEVTLHVPSR